MVSGYITACLERRMSMVGWSTKKPSRPHVIILTHGPQPLLCWRTLARSSGVHVHEDVGDTILLPRFLPCCLARFPVDHVVVVALERIEKFIQSRVSEHGLGQHLCAYLYRYVFIRGRSVRPDSTLPAGQFIILPARHLPVDDHYHNTSDSDAEYGLSACFGLVT